MWWEIPRHLEIKQGELSIAGKRASDLAEKFGTPLYVYNGKRVAEIYRNFYSTLKKYTDKEVRVHYAMKANTNLELLKTLNKEGAWADAVSPEEAERAIEAGFPVDKILYNGVSASNEDLKKISSLGIMINIDSVSELRRLKKIKPRTIAHS